MPVPIHRLPVPPRTLQSSLTQLDLDPSPVSQRRSTTFKPSTPGVWARVNPLWTSWPLRLTKEEVLEMGVDVDAGEQVSVVDVLKRWDPVDGVQGEVNRVGADDLAGVGSEDRRRTSKHRLNLTAHLLGVVPSTLETELPELDAGDALTISSGAPESSSEGKAARDQLVDVLSGRHVIMHDGYGPWSTRYCGHQFGVWAGQLGDGRAISILETTSDKGGRQEIQLKGAGRTPFSRHADGLAVLRSGVREYLGCEAVAALGIPTTRSLALLTAEDLPVIRETGPEPSSLTARIAPSFIRIGHFQALNPGEEGRRTRQIFLGGGYMTQDADREGPMGGQGSLKGLRELAGWCIGIMDELRVKEGRGEGKGGVGKEGEGDVGREEQKGELGVRGVRAFFEEVVRRNAEMVAGWQVYGFCHGVINTDNVSIFGLTIDYGPYAFMDVFDENHICNHSDPSGLYSYANQPSRILFALDKLQQSLAPLIGYEAVLSSRSRGNQGPDLAGVSLDDENLSAETVQELTDVGMDEMNGWEERYWRMEREAEARGWEKRFGLATSQNTDKREITQTFLRHLHAHGLDMSSAFRSLAHFDPIQATSSSNAEYIQGFIRDFIARTTPTSKPSSAGAGDTDSSELARETKSAEDAWTAWFSQYATRATEQAEQAAWAVAADASKVGEWNENRKQSILAANPRFVLRQWVLEELIKDMDEALGQGDEAGRREARKRLSGVLQMATRPFEPYGEDLPQNPESCPTPEAAEEQRLCGLGAKDMLGFQCSCSS